MATTDPRDWVFQGWIALRLPWAINPEMVSRVGNALVAHFPNMQEAVFDKERQSVSFFTSATEAGKKGAELELVLSSEHVSFRQLHSERAGDWKAFNLEMIGLLCDHTPLFESLFNVLMARQTIYIPIRSVKDPGNQVYPLVGSGDFLKTISEDATCERIGLDQEYVYRASDQGSIQLILRIQTASPSTTWIAADEIVVSVSAMVDPKPQNVRDIRKHWEEAQEVLFTWLKEKIRPRVIGPLLERLE